MLKFLLRPFCNHTYIQSVSCNSERVGDDNYVYSYEYYECKKCNRVTGNCKKCENFNGLMSGDAFNFFTPERFEKFYYMTKKYY